MKILTSDKLNLTVPFCSGSFESNIPIKKINQLIVKI